MDQSIDFVEVPIDSKIRKCLKAAISNLDAIKSPVEAILLILSFIKESGDINIKSILSKPKIEDPVNAIYLNSASFGFDVSDSDRGQFFAKSIKFVFANHLEDFYNYYRSRGSNPSGNVKEINFKT